MNKNFEKKKQKEENIIKINGIYLVHILFVMGTIILMVVGNVQI